MFGFGNGNRELMAKFDFQLIDNDKTNPVPIKHYS